MNSLVCKSELRREQVRQHDKLNGLDYLEVGLSDEMKPSLDNQKHLRVFFLGKAQVDLDKSNIRIEGGRRIRDIKVVNINVKHEGVEFDDFMEIEVDKAGDFSTYTLRVVEKNELGHWQPHSKFDPRYGSIDFSFKIDCPNDLDCKTSDTCASELITEPDINYLAKDYASFRQLILDRLALVMPEWNERHVPDIGIAIVEVLAYVGDYLSYYQDAVATEAYLNTARQRISVRRHARLVDYKMHEGCNARAWVCVEVTDNVLAIKPDGIYFITGFNESQISGKGLISEDELLRLPVTAYEVFEPMPAALGSSEINLYKDHSKIRFYTWGEKDCCLPTGSTNTTLIGEWINPENNTDDNPHCKPNPDPNQSPAASQPSVAKSVSQTDAPILHLQLGDVLIFQEVIGPLTGLPQDADPNHRHAIRLTSIEADVDPLTGKAIIHIGWSEEDALPFSLCLSSLGSPPNCERFVDVSIACGNVLLVDHGKTWIEGLGEVPKKSEINCCIGEGMVTDSSIQAGRYNPTISKAPLTFSQAYLRSLPASIALQQEVRSAVPQIKLKSIPPGEKGNEPLFAWDDANDLLALVNRLKLAASKTSRMLLGRLSAATQALLTAHDSTATALADELKTSLLEDLLAFQLSWLPQFDLLASEPDDRDFVVEMDDSSQAHIRFGNGNLGREPDPGMSFQAKYRVGNGKAGNVGAGAISHLVLPSTTLNGADITVSNPLPAQGGIDPELVAEVKLFAPGAFRKRLERAVIADDYATLVKREFSRKVQGAVSSLRWNGSWYEVLTAVDAFGREEADQNLLTQIEAKLYRYRRIGHDLSVKSAIRVALDIKLKICVKPNYLRGHVKAELLFVFSNKQGSNGRRGLFHPDELQFGDDIYLSKLVAAAQVVEGVESVEVTKLQRLQEVANNEIENGVLPLGPNEIARCDNDLGFPEFGKVELDLRGGR